MRDPNESSEGETIIETNVGSGFVVLNRKIHGDSMPNLTLSI